MQSPLFRPEALERISSPDQLDQLLKITRPRAWLALLGLGAVVSAVLFWSFGGSVPLQASGSGILTRSDTGLYGIQAPAFGTVTDVPMQIGEKVSTGQRLATIRAADGSQAAVTSPYAGTILSVSVEAGSIVDAGAHIGVLDPSGSALEAIAFIPADQGRSIEQGMSVRVQPSTVLVERYGELLGTVESISKFPATQARIDFLIENSALVRSLASGTPVYEVHVLITPDPNAADGYKWTSGRGPDNPLTGGTLCTVSVVLSEQHPASLAFPEPGR